MPDNQAKELWHNNRTEDGTRYVVFSPPVRWFDCQQDEAKTTERFSTKLGRRTGNRPRKKPLRFGSDLDKQPDQGFFFHFLNTLQDRLLFYIIGFRGNNL